MDYLLWISRIGANAIPIRILLFHPYGLIVLSKNKNQAWGIK